MVSNEIITSARPYLSFALGEELFAAGVEKVLEILEVPRITRIPGAPAYLRGVINLRGSVLPVIDTRTRFGMPPAEQTIDTCIMVLSIRMEDEVLVIGALADSVQEVLEFDQQQIKPAPTMGTRYRAEYIAGMVRKDEQFLMILDLDRVFSSDELISVKEASLQAQAE